MDDEPRISIRDASKLESKKNQKRLFTFTITLSAAYGEAVTMSYQTDNGTATRKRFFEPLFKCHSFLKQRIGVAAKITMDDY